MAIQVIPLQNLDSATSGGFDLDWIVGTADGVGGKMYKVKVIEMLSKFFNDNSGTIGIEIDDVVATYAELPTGLGETNVGEVYLVSTDNMGYVWDGSAFPSDGNGFTFNGADGNTPTIGVNGNWWIDGVDTGKPSTGTVSGSLSIINNSGSFERAALEGDVSAAQNSNQVAIAENAIKSYHIENGAVTTPAIANGSITAEKLAGGLLKYPKGIYHNSGDFTLQDDDTASVYIDTGASGDIYLTDHSTCVGRVVQFCIAVGVGGYAIYEGGTLMASKGGLTDNANAMLFATSSGWQAIEL